MPARRLALPLLLILACSWLAGPVLVAAHEGCGQHSPRAQAAQKALHRRLQALRAADAAAAATATTDADAAAARTEPEQRRLQQGGSGGGKPTATTTTTSRSSSSSSGGGGGKVGPALLRIGAVYQLKGVSSREATIIEKQLVPAAIKVLQKFVKVVRPEGPPRVSSAFFNDGQQSTCLISKVNPDLMAAAKANDLTLYVTADTAGCLPGMIAVATACEVDPATKRPVLGSLNICPASLAGLASLPFDSEAYGMAAGRLVEVLVHETIHVLGLGANHYEDWRPAGDPAGNKPYGLKGVVTWQGGRPYMSTPKVTQVAREYFGCPSLPGAPLEDEGPSFSALSHFEYRLLQRELMAPARPIDRSRSRLSAFTLAALEDTGWYAPDYTDAEPLDWGRGAGCEFVTSSCWDYMTKVREQPYFCGKGSVNQTRCTATASGWGACRSGAFTDGCLLVGKYSTAGSVAATVRDDEAASAADGRTAACYSPPQLEALLKGGSGGGVGQGAGGSNLLPLLGGSYSAKANDICYNLIAPPSSGGSAPAPGCTIPEDCAPKAKGSKGAVEEAGSRPVATSADLERLNKMSVAYKFYEHDARAGGAAAGGSADGGAAARAAACVSLASGAGSTSSSSSSAGGQKEKSKKGDNSSSSNKGQRRLLSLLSAAADSLAGLVLPQPPQPRRQLASTVSAGALSGLAALAGPAFTAVVAAPSPGGGPAPGAAACTSSPVLCFRSSCDASGRLFVDAQLPASADGSAATSSTRFACPSGKTVDLAQALAGRYLLGFLQCPSNQLVCETMGCGDCSPSGGVCSRGRCHCHMERFGPGCRGTLLQKV